MRKCENIHEELKVKILNLFIKYIYNNINFLKRKLDNCINRLKILLPLDKDAKYFNTSTKQQYEYIQQTKD